MNSLDCHNPECSLQRTAAIIWTYRSKSESSHNPAADRTGYSSPSRLLTRTIVSICSSVRRERRLRLTDSACTGRGVSMIYSARSAINGLMRAARIAGR